MGRKTKMLVYRCLHCNNIQTSILQWQTVSVAFEYKLRTGASEEVNREGGDHEAWACPECGKDLEQGTLNTIKLPF